MLEFFQRIRTEGRRSGNNSAESGTSGEIVLDDCDESALYREASMLGSVVSRFQRPAGEMFIGESMLHESFWSDALRDLYSSC